MKNKIFRFYCSIYSDIMNAGHCIVSAPNIARYYNISLYQARKILKELVSENMLVSDIESGYDDDNCKPYCYRGYRISNDAKNTKEYKQEKWRNSKLMAKCFEGTAYSYYK